MTPPAPAPLDLSGCDREPIRTPGLVQPHGALLGIDARTGAIARDAGIALTHLSDEGDGLESIFLSLTADAEVAA